MSHGTYALEMDGEPDDCLLLHLLQRKACARSAMQWFTRRTTCELLPMGSKLLYIVVGEGQQLALKAARVARLLEEPCDLYTAQTSDAPFPEDAAQTPVALSDVKQLALAESAPDVLFVSMAPLRLLDEYAADPPAFCWKYAHTRLVIYGSFNFRRVVSSGGGECMITMMHAFKDVYIYESYHATGTDNTINDDNAPDGLVDRIRDLPGMAQHMDQWDAWNMARMRDRCIEIDPSFPEALPDGHAKAERYARRRKIYHQLEAHAGRQMVLADMGLALTSTKDYHPVKVRMDPRGYTEATAYASSKIHMINALGHAKIARRLLFALASTHER